MPVESIFVLALILVAFGAFSGALAYADWQTRGLAQPAKAEPPADERKAA